MKRFVVAAIAIFAVSLFGGATVSAQSQRIESDLAVINVSIERIWPHRLGYVVQYRLPGNRVARAYLPAEWFASGDDRGERHLLSPGRSWPSMSVFFRGGEFSHVRLNVHRSHTHASWGYIPITVNIDDRFNVDTLELQF